MKLAEGENRLRHLALHDPSPACRTAPLRRAPRRRDRRHGRDGSVAAVLAIDLDHFKDINDTLGHHIGDGLISVVAQRLVHAVRREDLVARLGGDEFAVITTEAPDRERSNASPSG
jgi:diguanylate cyclase (GGDEF)-like protein